MLNVLTETAAQRTLPEPVGVRPPAAPDAPGVHALIAECPPLDVNSAYCNLLQCDHFAATSALAERGGAPCAFVSGYLMPGRDEVLFVWQVAVHERARGQGLAVRLVRDILEREACASVRFVHTTVTPDNTASRRMFGKLADALDTRLAVRRGFERGLHLPGTGEDEELLVIGPFRPPALGATAHI